jgi:hypothetical protein
VENQSQRKNDTEFELAQKQSARDPQSQLPESKALVQHTREEHFVDASTAAGFLSIDRRYLLKLSRLGLLPAHPLGIGSRRQWRYRISELAEWALAQNAIRPDNERGSPRAAKGRK